MPVTSLVCSTSFFSKTICAASAVSSLDKLKYPGPSSAPLISPNEAAIPAAVVLLTKNVVALVVPAKVAL